MNTNTKSVFSSLEDLYKDRTLEVIRALDLEWDFENKVVCVDQRIEVYRGLQFDQYSVFVDIFPKSLNESRIFSLRYDCMEELDGLFGSDLRIYPSRGDKFPGFSIRIGVFNYDRDNLPDLVNGCEKKEGA